jgi:transcriptional regulator GlxA family with amidase domain
MSPGRFYRDLRLRRAADLMRQTGMTVREAALTAGFSSQPVYSRACRQHFGLSPRAILAGAALPAGEGAV